MSLVYIYDEHLSVIKMYDTSRMGEATIDMKINEASTFYTKFDEMLPPEARYIAVQDPIANRRELTREMTDEFLLYRSHSDQLSDDGMYEYIWTEFAYDELSFDGYIKDKRPNNISFHDVLALVLSGTKWNVGVTNIEGTTDIDFYYESPMDAIKKINEKFPAEFRFWVRLGDDGTIVERIVDAVKKRGQNTGQRFETTSNVLSVTAQEDLSNIYSAIVPRGKGEQVSEGGDDGPDGYGRRITIADVEWSKAKGDPVDKPKGQEWIALEQGETLVDGRLRYKIVVFENDTDINQLALDGYAQLLKDSVPKIQLSGNANDLGVSELGDTVQVVDKSKHIEYEARIFHIMYDLLDHTNTKVEFGEDIISANSINSKIDNISIKQLNSEESINWAIQQTNGKNTTYYGNTEPSGSPRNGDTWFWDDGVNSGIKIFKSGNWVDVVDTKTLKRIDTAVDGAINDAKTYADELAKKQFQNTQLLDEKIDNSIKELSKSQQTIASQATAYTDSAVADANSKAVSIGQSAAQNAQSALDATKKDFTSSFASQASQTASMASAVDSKASQYASQAKSDAIAAATSADGVVRTEFKSTTDSMTATIQKNKSDADGKISTAQTTATQALNGLATKVSQTEYNTKTGQLQTDLTATTQTANQAKTDIVSIKQKDGEQDEKMNSIVSDVNGTKQTVSNLQTVQGKQSGDISTLQQRADGFDATVTRVNNLSVGGRNLIIRTGEITGRIIGAGGTLSPWDGSAVTQAIITVSQGNQLTMSGSSGGDNYFRYAFYDATGKTVVRSAVDLRSSTTITTPAGATTFRISYPQASQVKLERGNIATDWTPAPEDLSSATAKAQLTADQANLAINNYKTDADGRIEKAQADIVINSNAINTKVAKTDYDKKTGDLTTSVNKAQQTADTATQTIGTYKETNDKRVTAAETNIKANSDAISLTASKTELNNATGALNSNISTLKQRTDSFEQTVTQIQTKVNNLGNVNQLFNTEFSPDFSGWTTEYRWKNGLISDDYSFFKKEIWKVNSSSIMDYIIGNSAIIISEPLPYNESSGSVAASAYIGNGYNGSVVNDGVVALRIIFYDANKNFIGKSTGNTFVNSTSMAYVSDSMTPPSGTAYVAITLGYSGTTGLARISQPMLVFNSTSTGSYVPGNYNNNQAVAQVKLTADGVYQTVNDPKTGLNTRVSTAEGNITKVQSAVGSMSNTVTETADGLTREVTDRQTGDSNTLQAGKDFTTSQIKSYDTGMQSQITQTNNALVAQISSLNLLNNSQFEVVNGTLPGWHVDTPWGDTVKVGDGRSNNVSVNVSNPDGTTSLIHDYDGHSLSWLYSDPIPTTPNSTYSGSFELAEGSGWATASQVPFARYIRCYTKDRVLISSDVTNYAGGSIGGAWPRYSYTVKTPANAAYISFGLAWKGGKVSFQRLSMYSGSKDYGYMPSSKTSNQTALQLFKDNWSIGIKDNAGNLISGINGDSSGMTIAAKKLTVSPDTTFLGTNWLNGAIIKDASIGSAQIAKASITDANILNLDVNKITGNVANFIKTYWDGQYGSTSITSAGMTVNAGVTKTVFDENGMLLTKSNRSVGRIGVNDLYQDFSKKGLYFGLEATGDFMAWGAQNYAGNPYSTKLSWFRAGAVPSNLPGLIEGFNFEDNVAFISPVEMRGGIKMQGANDRLLVRASNLNGGSYPTFGGPSAYFVYAGSDIYLSSNGTAVNLTKIAKAFGGIRTAAIPTGFNSNGTATGWYNIDMG